jgi:hypothetical protein
MATGQRDLLSKTTKRTEFEPISMTAIRPGLEAVEIAAASRVVDFKLSPSADPTSVHVSAS